MGVKIVNKEINKKECCIGRAQGCGGSHHQGEIKHIVDKQEH